MHVGEKYSQVREAYPSATTVEVRKIVLEMLQSEVNERDSFIASLKWWLDKDAPAEEILNHVRHVMNRAPKRMNYES